MRVLPIQMNLNKKEAEIFLKDCLISLNRQTGLGQEFRITLYLCLFSGASKVFVSRLVKRWCSRNISVRILEVKKDMGYGAKQNLLFEKWTGELAGSDCFITLNPDVILKNDCLKNLLRTYARNPEKNLIVEARQFPLENPPRNFSEAERLICWSSGACLLISREFFRQVGGFDENLYLYCEDVDLSWQCWLFGGHCVYAVDAICAHITRSIYTSPAGNDGLKIQDRHTLLSHLLLCWKYFGNFPRIFRRNVAAFREFPAPANIKEAIWGEFQARKQEIIPVAKRHPMIQAYDVGLYHIPRI